MTKKGHNKGSVRSHNQIKENAKEVGMRKVRDIEFEKELMEMKAWLNVLMELLQQDVEDHRCGWVLQKKGEVAQVAIKVETQIEYSVEE